MSIQTIINVCETLQIDRRKVVGVQYTRSEIAKISSTPTRNPWKFELNVSAGLQYSKCRSLIEDLDSLDRMNTETVSFNGVPGQSFIFAYQGVMTGAQVSAITVQSFTGTNLVLTNLPAVGVVGASNALFKKGDFIQLASYPHPFTVTQDVVRGTNTATTATVTLSVHRPNFITASVVGQTIKVGNDVQFKVFCPNMPTYRLVPGGTDAIVEWTSAFQLYEYTGDVA
jgi:hypothetical protein